MEKKQFIKILEKNYDLYKKYSIALSNLSDPPDDILQETMLYLLENAEKINNKFNFETEVNKYIYTVIQFSNYKRDGRTNLSSFQNKYNKLKTVKIGQLKDFCEEENNFNYEIEQKYKKIDELVEKYDKTGIISKMINSNNPNKIKKNNAKIYNSIVTKIKKQVKNEKK